MDLITFLLNNEKVKIIVENKHSRKLVETALIFIPSGGQN
jgi:hypothetical protein